MANIFAIFYHVFRGVRFGNREYLGELIFLSTKLRIYDIAIEKYLLETRKS